MRVWKIMLLYLLVFGGILAATVYFNQAVTVISQNTPLADRHCIVIDPGHGGVDGGATSCTGVLEKDINLQISLRLRDLFSLLGHPTKLLRSTDISVYTEGETIAAKKVSDLKQRVRIVSETENALLLSIHQNYFSDSRYSGAQVFFGREENGQILSRQLQTAFIEYLNPGSRRQSKKSSGVYLMEHITCPGVLIECGFLSNPEEETKLRSEAYQKQLSCVIAVTVSNFLDE